MGFAVVTGASRGLGLAIAETLADRGWSLVIDARGEEALSRAEADLRGRLASGATLVSIAGDVADPHHRQAIVAAASRLGRIDVLMNNASALGPSPLPHLDSYPLDAFRRVLEVNVVAPLALAQECLPLLRRSPDPRIVNVSSDASVEAYEGWGGYGSSKAALDHLSAVLAAEEPTLRVWALDPGDMRTQMHQDAFPGEDISDRPPPESVVPGIVALLEGSRPSGRYRLSQHQPATEGTAP